MKKTSFFALFLALSLLTACGSPAKVPAAGTEDPAQQETVVTTIGETAVSHTGDTAVPDAAVPDPSEMFTRRDLDPSYETSRCAVITLEGTTASCTSNAVKIEGGTVTITDEGTYLISGTLTEGSIVVDAEKSDKTQLVLQGASVTSASSAALYVRQADKVFVTLAAGTENSLNNGGGFTADGDVNVDAALFSREDLTVNGEGKLKVTSPAGHGIVSKDSLTVTGGALEIESAGHGLAGKDSIAIREAAVTVASGKDGIHGEHDEDAALGLVVIESGAFTIAAEGDGISAASALDISGGTFSVITGGGSANAQQKTSQFWGSPGGRGGKGGMGGFPGGMGGFPGGMEQSTSAESSEDSESIKGLKAGTALTVTGGTFSLDTADDGVHSNGNITVTGGSFTIASGDDGFHADDTLTVAGGTVEITESYEGLEGLHVLITGGSISLVADDDGLNAAGGNDNSGMGGFRGGDRFGGMGGSSSNGSIVISGGTVKIRASGDGIDANGTVEITGGNTVVCGPTQGDTSTLDYDISAVITGGTFIGTGAAGMAQSFSGAEQGVLAVRTGNIAAGTPISLADSTGKVLLSHTPELGYAVIILSCPELISGQTYTLTVGTQSQTMTAQ